MKALIKSEAADWGNCNNSKPDSLHQYLVKNRGKWVVIDTSHIFNNQYNTIDGYRIYDSHIQEIEDDVRFNLGKCKYCVNITDHALPCLKNADCVNYGVSDLSKSFFCKFPQGHDLVKQVDIRDDKRGNKDFYSLFTVNGLYYRLSRRKNIHFVLVKGVPYIVGIGYTHYLSADLSSNEVRILERAAKLINEA